MLKGKGTACMCTQADFHFNADGYCPCGLMRLSGTAGFTGLKLDWVLSGELGGQYLAAHQRSMTIIVDLQADA